MRARQTAAMTLTGREQLAAAFPYYLEIDRRLQIIEVGPALRQAIPALEPGRPLTIYFELLRPEIEPSLQGFVKTQQTVCLRQRGGPLLLQGLFIPNGSDQALLLATPRTQGDFARDQFRWDILCQLLADYAGGADRPRGSQTAVSQSSGPPRPAADVEPREGRTTHPKISSDWNPRVKSGRHAPFLDPAQALRDAGAVTAGHLRLRKGPWRVVELTQEALEVVSASASHRRQTLVAEVGCPDEVVHVDHERMVQVLVNLLCNAIKFTTAGGSVTLRAHLDGRTLCFQVQDTGIGILPEYHGRIFEQFMEPSEASHRDPKRGLGIGLYLARALTRLHGGDITVASRPGAGSTFTVSLPV